MPAQTRWLTIATSIKTAIDRGELSPGAPIASELDMAKQWDVSPMTVHRAMSELQREGWVVRRRRAGTVVADRSSLPLAKIGLVFTTLRDQPQSGYLSGIEENLAERYQLLPFSTNNSVEEEAKRLRQAADQCSGIICYPHGAPENTPILKEIMKTHPVVFVDRLPEGINADVVMTDNYGSMRMGLGHLASLGHTRIAYFMQGDLLISSTRERYMAYLDFMQQIGQNEPDRWVHKFPWSLSIESHFQEVESALAEMLGEPDPVTAVACQQDVSMVTVLEAAVHLGVTVPDDLAVLSFNDISSRLLMRGINRLVQRPTEMGHMAAQRIKLRLAAPETPPQEMRMMTDFFPAHSHTLTPAGSAYVAARLGKQQ